MTSREIVDLWFQLWEEGRYAELPITDDFTHTSPFGTIEEKEEYLTLVEKSREKFLEHRFKDPRQNYIRKTVPVSDIQPYRATLNLKFQSGIAFGMA